MLMSGLPTALHLQDRFLGTKLRASEVLHERIRTRVFQGAGRCTRGPKGLGGRGGGRLGNPEVPVARRGEEVAAGRTAGRNHLRP
jgi:hypothetical protein